MLGVLAQAGPQQRGVMIAGVVDHHYQATSASSVAPHAFEEASERVRVDHGAHVASELAGAQIERAKASDGFACGYVQQDWIPVLRRHPYAAARPVLLEMSVVRAPQLHIRPSSQSAQSFFPLRLSVDRSERLGGGACVAESPSAEIISSIGVHPHPRHSGISDARRARFRPIAWRSGRRPTACCADRLGACATVPHRPRGADRPYCPPAERPVCLAQSGGSGAGPRCRPPRADPPLAGATDRPPLATIHAADGRSGTVPLARSPAGWRSSSPGYPRPASCASISSQRKRRCDYIAMPRHLCFGA